MSETAFIHEVAGLPVVIDGGGAIVYASWRYLQRI